ncbi:MAG: hypothetical protein E6G81_13585 [Alphaproteobacteria bacterium]|nr:MAG: hypothetical protein E6G81_13585 [Alphaproteobacteria bacterium]
MSTDTLAPQDVQAGGVDWYFYPWLGVQQGQHLITFSLDDGQSSKKSEEKAKIEEFTAKIAMLDHKARRCLSPPSTPWDEVHRQLLNVIISAHQKQYHAAAILSNDAEQTFQKHNQTRNRSKYLSGFLIGTVVTVAVGVLILLVINYIQDAFEIKLLASMLVFAGLGSITSALSRVASVDLRDETNDRDVLLSGAVRPIVAICFAILFYVLLKMDIIEIKGWQQNGTPWVFLAAAFLCGYSERFADDIVGRLQRGA